METKTKITYDRLYQAFTKVDPSMAVTAFHALGASDVRNYILPEENVFREEVTPERASKALQELLPFTFKVIALDGVNTAIPLLLFAALLVFAKKGIDPVDQLPVWRTATAEEKQAALKKAEAALE